MADMTDEEYDALDERWTKTTPKVNFSRPGVFARQRALAEADALDEALYISVNKVQPLNDYTLELTCESQETRIFDVKPYPSCQNREHGIYCKLGIKGEYP